MGATMTFTPSGRFLKQPCADVGDGFQLPRAAVALDELAGQRARLEPEHDLVRGLRDFREGAEREDDRRGRYGNFCLACRALPDGHFLRHAVVLYADFGGVHEVAADRDERIEIVRGDKAGLAGRNSSGEVQLPKRWAGMTASARMYVVRCFQPPKGTDITLTVVTSQTWTRSLSSSSPS